MSQLTSSGIIIHLLVAALSGLLIGAERRAYAQCPAGVRTHMLVSIGACIVMMTSANIFATYRIFGVSPDPARLPAQIIVGIGFLGAGCILHDKGKVSGLSTAASLWTIACLGIVAGTDFYLLTFAATLIIFFMLLVADVRRRRIRRARIDRIIEEALRDEAPAK